MDDEAACTHSSEMTVLVALLTAASSTEDPGLLADGCCEASLIKLSSEAESIKMKRKNN